MDCGLSPVGGDTTIADQITDFMRKHPILGPYIDEVCVALTGSFAFGLGGKGADVDAVVLCPPEVYEAVKHEPEGEFPFVVGDYTVESLSEVWHKVESYADMTSLFIYGNLNYICGDKTLLDPLVSHCRNLPTAVLNRETERERTDMDQALYAFLRSFQTADPVARLLTRAAMVRSALRLAFLAEGAAPPYDKHLFRLLPRLGRGEAAARLISDFLGQSAGAAEAGAYAAVAASEDWHAMYACATETPAVGFHHAVLSLLGWR